MKKALLFGRNGLLGQALYSTLEKSGWAICAPTHEEGDARNREFLEDCIRSANADCIFNATGWTAVDAAEDHVDEAFEMNANVPASMAAIIARMPKGRFIHYGTDFIFSGNEVKAKLEEDLPQPLSIYGNSKLSGERAVLNALPSRACVIRTAWLFGPGRKNFVDTIINAARKNDSLKVVADQRGSPTFTADLADWSVKLAPLGVSGVFHGVNSGQASWHELASEAARLAGLSCRIVPISSDEWPQKALRPSFSVLSNDKLSRILGRKPRPWKEALREYLDSRAINSANV